METVRVGFEFKDECNQKSGFTLKADFLTETPDKVKLFVKLLQHLFKQDFVIHGVEVIKKEEKKS